MTRLIAKAELKLKRESFCTQEEMTSLLKADSKDWDFGRGYYGHIETGVRSVGPDIALAIARILKCDVNDIFSSEEKKEEEQNHG